MSNLCSIPDFYVDIFLFSLQCAGNVCGWVYLGCLRSVANDSLHTMHRRGGRVGARWWGVNCAILRAKLFWRAIYCANLRPGTEFQSVYQYRRVIGRRAPWIMREHDLATAIKV